MRWNAKRPVFANMEFGALCILCTAHTRYLLKQCILPPPQRLEGVGLIVGNFCTGVERLEAAGSLHPSLYIGKYSPRNSDSGPIRAIIEHPEEPHLLRPWTEGSSRAG